MKFDVVVAQYKEDVRWIGDLVHPSIRKIFVYTKGPVVRDMSDERVFHSYLPNVGRESHTYLWHCVHNFRSMASGEMADFTFFLQGSPHAMNPRAISDWIDEVEKSSLSFTLNYRLSNPYDFLSSGRIKLWSGPTQSSDSDVREWCESHVAKGVRFENMPIFWNACFGASTECIVASGRERLANIQQRELSTINPECGHYCERLWYHIFAMERFDVDPLPEGFWHFFGGPKGKRHYGIMRLRDDGSVGFYDNFNERHWHREGSSIVLKNAEGKVTSVLVDNGDGTYSGEFVGSQKSVHKISRRNPFKE